MIEFAGMIAVFSLGATGLIGILVGAAIFAHNAMMDEMERDDGE